MLVYPKIWTHRASGSLSPRLLFATVEDLDGLTFHFLAGHMDHVAKNRQSEWNLLLSFNKDELSCNLIMLCDHNSATLPTRDVAQSPAYEEDKDTLKA